MSRRYLFSVLLLITITIIYSRCTTNKYDVDISNINIELVSNRLDDDIVNIDTLKLLTSQQQLKKTYGDFFPIFTEQIIRIGDADSLSTISELYNFTQDQGVSSIQEHINSLYTSSTIKLHNFAIETSLKRWKFHFTKKNTPSVVYFNSAFNYGIVTTDNHIGVGLDFYLGKSDTLIAKMPGEIFNQYEKDKMDPLYLDRDAVEGWIRKELSSFESKKNLLSMIVYEGKILFILNSLFPNSAEELIIRYTPEELKWVNENKINIWKEIADQKVIFGSKNFENQKWIINGPFTNVGAIPNDSPARIGCWIGWQMVKEFMNDHPDYSLQQLMNESNYQKFLNAYKP